MTPNGPTTDELLRALLATAGRVAVPPDELRRIVSPSSSPKYINAYNLCDGTLGVTEVARRSGLDKANLAKSVNRWVDVGVMFKIGDAPNLLHLYRISGGASGEQADGGEAIAAASRNRIANAKRTRLTTRTNGAAPAESDSTAQVAT
jgi:hypothetical protein